MAQVVGLGENALVEGEPGELPIDEACLGMEVDRLDLDRPRTGSHVVSPDACSQRILSYGWGPVMLPPGSCGDRPGRGRTGRSNRAKVSIARFSAVFRLAARLGDPPCICCT